MSALPKHELTSIPFVDPALMAIARQARDSYAERTIPEEQRAVIRQTYTARRFYEEWLQPEREARVDAGRLSRGTLSKDRQSLSRWEKLTRPPVSQWPASKPWEGIPLGFITGGYLDEFIRKLRDSYAEATAFSTWTHLRTIFNAAAKMQVLEQSPAPSETPKMEGGDVEIFGTVTTADGGLTKAYKALEGNLLLQTAFVLSVNAGLRPIDLFLLDRTNLDLDAERPAVSFKSRKTKKSQRVPLAPCVVSHLRRLIRLQGESESFLFPGCSNSNHKEPEKSREARHRTKLTKTLLKRAGFEFEKPWQVARATCNERYESSPNGSGVGEFILGHSRKSVNARSYRQPTQAVYEAVQTLPQPACFLSAQ